MPPKLKKLTSLLLCLLLILQQTSFAQTLNLSHYFTNPAKPTLPSDKFRPLHLRYLGYDNLNQDFKLLLDKGDTKKEDLENKTYIEENTQTLLKYFFIGLALPNDKFWVNLRPDSPDNILDDDLAKTDIGRIFLEADVQLKKDTASFTSPQTPEGKAYWDKLYQKAGELFGTENITIPTLTRPWIVPNEIIIREATDNAYIYKATLKVMLEEDCLTERTPAVRTPHRGGAEEVYRFSDPRLKELNQYSTQLIKELIIPKLTYQVNTSKRYAPLRQVYYSLILAQWFKQKYKGKVTPYSRIIDSNNLTPTYNLSLITSHSYSKDTYFKQYQKSFADGEYYLQETVYSPSDQSIRRYVSGGAILSASPIETVKILAGSSGKTLINKAMYLSEVDFSGSPITKDVPHIRDEKEDTYLIYHATVPEKLPGIIEGGLRSSKEVISFLYDSETRITVEHIYGVVDPKIAVTHVVKNGVHDSIPELNAQFSKKPVLLELRLPKDWVKNHPEAKKRQGDKMKWEIFEEDLKSGLATSYAGIVIPVDNVPPEFIFVQSGEEFLPIEEYAKLKLPSVPVPQITLKNKDLVLKPLGHKNWYYRSFTDSEKMILRKRLFEELNERAAAHIKELAVLELKKQGIHINESAITAVLIYGSWCYDFESLPADLDIAVIVDGIDKNIRLKAVTINNPEQWFNDKKRMVSSCDISFFSKGLIAQSNTKDKKQLISEAQLWGNGIIIEGEDPLAGKPNSDVLLSAAESLLDKAQLLILRRIKHAGYGTEVSNFKNVLRLINEMLLVMLSLDGPQEAKDAMLGEGNKLRKTIIEIINNNNDKLMPDEYRVLGDIFSSLNSKMKSLSSPVRLSSASSAVETNKELTQLLEKDEDAKSEFDFLKNLGVWPGIKITDIGPLTRKRGIVAALMGADYIKYELSQEEVSSFRYSLVPLGYYKVLAGDFDIPKVHDELRKNRRCDKIILERLKLDFDSANAASEEMIVKVFNDIINEMPDFYSEIDVEQYEEHPRLTALIQLLLKKKNYPRLNSELLEVIYPLKRNRDVSINNFQIGSGTYSHIPGEFSSGENSKSNKIDYREGYIPDHSQDIIIAITGALSDPIPESDAQGVFREMLRVIKPGGKLVIGTYLAWYPYQTSDKEIERILSLSLARMEYVKFRKVVMDVLKEKEWEGRVRINLNNVDAWDLGFSRFSIFEIYFTQPIDNDTQESAKIGQVFDDNTDSAGSPIDSVGGIAFNALPIQTQTIPGAVSSLTSSAAGGFTFGENLQPLTFASIPDIDLDAEWAQIQAVFNAGIRPSIDRLSRYSLAAAASPLSEERIDQVRGMLADILRREEEDEKLSPAEPALKNLIAALEA